MTNCKICGDPLVVEVDHDDEGDRMASSHTVPDDLELSCGDHFHWQCLLDTSPTTSLTLKCPSCHTYLPTPTAPGPSATNQANPYLSSLRPSPSSHTAQGQSQILATYTNEGGVQHNIDLLPLITEEAYLDAHPEARPAKALHLLVEQGDVEGVVGLWRDVESGHSDSDDDDDVVEGDDAGDGGQAASKARMTVSQLIRWQDPLNSDRSALHVAVAADQEEMAWLLFWVGSTLEHGTYPAEAIEGAKRLGLDNPPVVEKRNDIRALKDGQGRTAGDLAAAKGPQSVWGRMLRAGAFEPT